MKRLKLVLENAKTINKLHDNILKTFSNKEKDLESWKRACKLFHENYDRLAFPGGLAYALELLDKKSPEIIDIAIEWLKINPNYLNNEINCFSSVFQKIKIIRKLKHCHFNTKQINQIHALVINSLTKATFEFPEYCRLAKNVYSEDLEFRLKEIISQNPQNRILNRAKRMLYVITQNKSKS